MTPKELLDAFEVLADAPAGVDRLRELVLRLAVRGELVAQDPAEGTAKQLLGRIEVERSRLHKSGKGKKPNDLPPVDDAPFEIPDTWSWTRFGDITDCRLGKMLDKAKNKGPLRPYLRNANLQWFRFELDDLKQLRLDDSEMDECSLAAGDLVICEGGEPGRCAVCDNSVDGMVYQKALHRARPYCGISPWYLAYLLRCDAMSGRIAERFTGATIKHLTGRSLALHTVPLPPVGEQHRIVARVEELMALLDRLEAAQQSRESTRQSLRDAALSELCEAEDFQSVVSAWDRVSGEAATLLEDPGDVEHLREAIVGLAVKGCLVAQASSDPPASQLVAEIASERADLAQNGLLRNVEPVEPMLPDEAPFDLPSGWIWAKCQSLFLLVTDGDHQPPPRSESGVPFLVIGNVSSGLLDFAKTRFVPRHYYEALDWTRRPARGDILYTVTGSFGIALVVDTLRQFCVQRHIGILKSASAANPDYLRLALSSPSARAFAAAGATGTAQKTVSLSTLRSIPIPVPPRPEQDRIVAKVNELMSLCDDLEGRLGRRQSTAASFSRSVVTSFA